MYLFNSSKLALSVKALKKCTGERVATRHYWFIFLWTLLYYVDKTLRMLIHINSIYLCIVCMYTHDFSCAFVKYYTDQIGWCCDAWSMRKQLTLYQHRNHIPKWRRAFTWRKSATTSILIKHSNVRIETVAWLPTADTATASECGSIILPSFPWDPASLGSSATLAIPLIELQTNHLQSFRNHRESPNYYGLLLVESTFTLTHGI